MKQTLHSLILLVLISLCALPQVHAQGNTIYAALYKENNLAIINPSAGAIIQRIQVGRNPDYVALNADKTKLFVSNTGEYSVSIVNLVEKKESQVLRLPVNRRNIYAGCMAASPDASKLYVAERNEAPEPLRIYVIDMNKEMQIAQFDIGNNANSLSVSNDGTKLFVVEQGAAVKVFDTETYKQIGTVPLVKGMDAKVQCIACSPVEPKAFITYGDGNTLQAINTGDYKTLGTVTMPKYKTGFQRDVYVSGNGKYAYIVNDKAVLKDVEGILVYEIAKNEIVKIFNAGNVPRGMTVTEDGTMFYVASNMLKWYDIGTLEHLKSMSLKTEIRGIAVVTGK